MFERHAGGERVILVALDFGDLDFAESVAELRLLAAGAGLEILGEVQGKRSRPDAALFVGSGKADEIAALVAATEADVVISLNHFKGHEMTGFGGAIKNLGMGSGSRGGKLDMHSGSKPQIDIKNCIACGKCIKNCSQGAIHFNAGKKAEIDYEKCIGCGQCIFICRDDAAQVREGQSSDVSSEKIAEYAYAVVKDKPSFHVNFIMNVSPDCDCFYLNDLPIVPEIGIAASFDPVALDRACVDLVNQAPVMKGSILDEKHYREGEDKFTCIHPKTSWKVGLNHAEEIGLGTQEYELITIK